jgi:hypothetical protein
VGQVSDPYEQAEGEGLGISIPGAFELDGLVDDQTDDETGGEPGGKTDDEVVYELDDWSEIERAAVSDRLREAGIAHGWEGTSLLVAAVDDDAVENILDIVEGDAGPPLDPHRDQVAYDLSEWDDDRLTALAAALGEADIAHGWQGDELFVYAADEQTVDEVLDRVVHPHELPAEDDDGAGGGELLGEVFVAADRLQRDPGNHEGAVAMLDLGQAVEGAAPPYGLGAREWDHLRGRITALCAQLRAPTVDEDAVMGAARDLRNALRSYV